MAREFAVDGTGNIIRPGDEVIVHATTLTRPGGKGTVISLPDVDNSYAYVLIHGAERPVHLANTYRADDTRRTPGGTPLWCY